MEIWTRYPRRNQDNYEQFTRRLKARPMQTLSKIQTQEKFATEPEFVSLENNIDITTPIGMLLFTMCVVFSEMERELIKERVKAGLDAVHAKGKKGGRPKALTPEKEGKLKSLMKRNEFSVTEICNIVGITRSVYYRSIKNDVT